jgi:hypothetical protein
LAAGLGGLWGRGSGGAGLAIAGCNGLAGAGRAATGAAAAGFAAGLAFLGAARRGRAFFAGFVATVFLRAAGFAADVFRRFALPLVLPLAAFLVAICGLPGSSPE